MLVVACIHEPHAHPPSSAANNGLTSREDVRRIIYEASYLVLGLGDVYLVSLPGSAGCAATARSNTGAPHSGPGG